MKHCWAVTDSQGYAMQCVKCGIEILHPSLTLNPCDGERWDRQIDAICSAPCPDTCPYHDQECNLNIVNLINH